MLNTSQFVAITQPLPNHHLPSLSHSCRNLWTLYRTSPVIVSRWRGVLVKPVVGRKRNSGWCLSLAWFSRTYTSYTKEWATGERENRLRNEKYPGFWLLLCIMERDVFKCTFTRAHADAMRTRVMMLWCCHSLLCLAVTDCYVNLAAGTPKVTSDLRNVSLLLASSLRYWHTRKQR